MYLTILEIKKIINLILKRSS